jgi:hypothetical protein
MPIEIQGVVSDFAAAGLSSRQAALTREDLERYARRLKGMRITDDHNHPLTKRCVELTAEHPAHTAECQKPVEHKTIGVYTDAWVDDVNCLRVLALVDDDVSDTVAQLIREGKLSGFSLGINHGCVEDVGSNEFASAKELVECSITPNPEYKLTSYIAGVRNLSKEVADTKRSVAVGDNSMAVDGVDSYKLDRETAGPIVVSASSGKRTPQQMLEAADATARIDAARRMSAARGEQEKEERRVLLADAARAANGTQNSPSRFSMSQQQQQQQQQQQPQFDNRAQQDRALQTGQGFSQAAPRSDVTPVVIQHQFLTQPAPVFESAGLGNGAHARRQAQIAAHNNRALAPLRARNAEIALTQALLAQLQAQQEQEEFSAGMQQDGADGGAYDDGNGQQNYYADDQMAPPPVNPEDRYRNAPPRQPSQVRASGANRIQLEKEAAEKAEFAFFKATGKIRSMGGGANEEQRQWQEFQAAKAAKENEKTALKQLIGKRGRDNGVKQRTEGNNPNLSLGIEDDVVEAAEALSEHTKSGRTGAMNITDDDVAVNDDDDIETMALKLKLKQKLNAQKRAEKAKETYSKGDTAAATTGDDDDDDVDDKLESNKVKRLQRQLDIERARNKTNSKVSSIKSKLNSVNDDGDDDGDNNNIGEGGIAGDGVEDEIDEMQRKHEKLSKLLRKNEDGSVTALQNIKDKSEQLMAKRRQLIGLSATINKLNAKEMDDEVKTLLESKMRQKQKLERGFNEESADYAKEVSELIRKVYNANGKKTPELTKQKLVNYEHKPSYNVQDIKDLFDTSALVIETVSASNDTAASTLERVKKLQSDAKNYAAQQRFEARERDEMTRKDRAGVSAQQAVSASDPFSKAARSQDYLNAALNARAISDPNSDLNQSQQQQGKSGGRAAPATPGGNGAGVAFAHLKKDGEMERLRQPGKIVNQGVGGYSDYEGYNEETMRRNIDPALMTPNELYGLPYKFIDANQGTIGARAAAAGIEKCFAQKQRKPPVQGGVSVKCNAWMTGDPIVLNGGIKDEIMPGMEAKLTRAMFSGKKEAFKAPNSRSHMINTADRDYYRLDSEAVRAY